MMQLLNKDSINYLPVHDSGLIAMRIVQHKNGETDLIIDIRFYKGEYEEIEEKWLKLVDSNGRASFFLKNCTLIKMSLFCDTTRRDQFDFIQIEEPKDENKGHIVVDFISGSKIECAADLIALIKYEGGSDN